VVSHINITDKKLALQNVIEREKELSALNIISRTVNRSSISLEAITNAILEQISVTINPDLTMLFLKKGEKLLLNGISPNKTPYNRQMNHVHQVGQCLCGLSVSTGESIIAINIHDDDRCTWEECKKVGITSFAAIPLKNRNNVIGTLGIASKKMRDFRERQHFLEAIANDIAIYLDNSLLYEKAKAYANDLEIQLSERNKMEKQLQQAQKMEAIGTLASGIAHDFNNILSPLVGYSEMLKDELPADHPFQANADIMLSSALRAKELVQRILSFSRQPKSEIKPIKPKLIIKEALKLIRSSIPTTIDIEQYIDSGCGLVNADATKFHQIIMNLTTNAYHAMKEDGGKLTVTLKQIRIEQDHSEQLNLLPGTYAHLTVADTGIGINKDIIDKIFDPYFTTKEKEKGTGLGLSVVHGIVKGFDGAIHIYSERGKGTDVHVYIPIIAGEAAKGVFKTKSFPGGTENILLVDDEEVIVVMQKQMLERLGYHVTTRTGSIEALEAFKNNPDKFDLIITDMAMPNMTGIQLAQEIKNLKADIPIIICTGFSEQLTDESWQALGINGYVMKPVIIRELAGTIRNVLKTSM